MKVKVQVKCMGEWLDNKEYEINVKDDLEGPGLDYAIFDAIYNSIDFKIIERKATSD